MTTFLPLTILLLSSLSFDRPVAHPHVPRAIVLQGAGGKATLTWFTVPYNKEQVKTLPKGAQWHLGFAALDVAMPLRVGTTSIPVGKYKLDVARDQDGGFATFVLTPLDLLMARRVPRGQNPDQSRIDAVMKDLAAKGIPERIELASASAEGKAAEHLAFAVLHHGYETVERGSIAPKGGASFTLLADFGDLHRKLELVEQFAGASSPSTGK